MKIYILWSPRARAWVGVNGYVTSIFDAKQFPTQAAARLHARKGEEVCPWDGE